jgi:hypothetical protein
MWLGAVDESSSSGASGEVASGDAGSASGDTEGAEGGEGAEGTEGTEGTEGSEASGGADGDAGGAEGSGDAEGGDTEGAGGADASGDAGDAGDLGTATRRTGAPSVLAGAWVPASELGQFASIKDVSQGISPQTGKLVADEGVLNALAIVNGFTPEMLALVRSISAPDRVKTMIALTNNVEVAFGAAEDIAAKEQVIRTMLVEHEGAITYINVRVADRATYRATS